MHIKVTLSIIIISNTRTAWFWVAGQHFCGNSWASVSFDCVQACRVIGGPEPEANEMEAGSFPRPGQGGQHKVSPPGGWDSGLQRSQDSDGEGGAVCKSI